MHPCRHTVTLAVLVLALGACGDSNDPGDDPLPNDAATAVGLTVRDNIEAAFDGFHPRRLLEPLSTGVADEPCVTPSAATDTDGDGIPNAAQYTFTAPPCEFDVRGFTLNVVGQLRIEDPAPEAPGFGANITITNLRFTLDHEEAEREYSVTRNGLMSLTGDPAGLALATDLQVVRTFSGLPDAFAEHVWTLGFDPETTLQINQPLPSGSVSAAGTVTWTRGDESFELTVTTVTPLHYDAGCSQPGQRFDEGELSVAGTFGETPGAVHVRWEECGRDPRIEFIEAE